MIRTLSTRLLRLLAVLVTALTVAVALFAWRIASGPLPLDWLTPYIADALSAEDGSVEVAVGGTELRLSRTVDLVELVVVGVRATGADGALLAELPEIEVGLSLQALLRGMIAVARLEATAPHLLLLHREDGSIGLRGTEAGPEGGQIDLRLLAAQLFGPADQGDPSSYFERLEIRGGRLTLVDQRSGHRLEAQGAELIAQRQVDGFGSTLAFALMQGGEPASVRLTGRYDRATGWLDLGLDVDQLMPAALASLAPDLPLGGIDLAITGHLQGKVKLDGERAPVRFALTGGPGRVDLPDLLSAPLPIEALRAEGELAGDLASLVVQRFEVTSNEASLTGAGRLSWQGEIGLDAEIEARNVKARDLELFWPPDAADEARTWVVSNITDGIVPQARATIAIRPGDLAQRPVPERIVDGSFLFRDLTLHYFEELPPLTGVDGSATFTARRMDYAITTGQIGDIMVEDGSIVITGMGIPGREATQLEVRAKGAGPLRDVLTVIDYPPLNFAAEADLKPDDVSGSVTGELSIGLPLHRGEILDSEVRVAVSATLSDAALRTPSFALQDGELALTADNAGFDLVGDGAVEQIPLKIAFRENFADDAPFARRYRVQGLVDDAALARLGGSDLPLDLEGAFGLDATIVEARGVREVEVALDLLPLAIAAPALDWRKAAGQPGSLGASLVLREGAPIQVQALELSAPDLEASGSLQLQAEPLALESLMLERLVIGRTEGVLAVRRGADQAYEVNLEAQSLDLQPFFDTDDAAPDDPPEPLRLELRAQRAVLNGNALREVSADLTRDEQGWRSAWISALLPGGGALEVTLAPEVTAQEAPLAPEVTAAPAGERRRLHVTTDDAGDLLATIDQTSRIVGGTLDLDAYVSRQHPALALEGELRVTGFTVRQAPLLARLLTVASLTGIGNLLSGQGIYFDRFEVPFGYRREVLSVDRVRLSGSQLGLTAKGTLDVARDQIDLAGTIVPIYGLNWAIGKIPILGDFLRGSEGEGAFAMTYSVSGAAGDPRILVNPLAVLAPGMIRELFSGILEGTTRPPEVPQDSD